jgi:hypothetical protein
MATQLYGYIAVRRCKIIYNCIAAQLCIYRAIVFYRDIDIWQHTCAAISLCIPTRAAARTRFKPHLLVAWKAAVWESPWDGLGQALGLHLGPA